MVNTTILIGAIGALAFIWPLLSIHARLDEEKARAKGEANRRLKTAISEFHRQIDNQHLTEVGPLIQTIGGLKQELELLDKIPTWPWQPDTLRTVATAILLPIAVWLAQRALSFLLDI